MIEIPIFLVDKSLNYLGVKTEDTEAKMSIKKDKIYGVRERMTDDATELSKDTCFIYTENETFVVGITYSQMIQLLK